jgi:hypothetical protein
MRPQVLLADDHVAVLEAMAAPGVEFERALEAVFVTIYIWKSYTARQEGAGQ